MKIKANIIDDQGPIELSFRNLRCTTKNKEKVILNNLSGTFSSGSLIALMGPSGSGKTTLLNILSAYAPQNATCASLQLNGQETNFEYLKSISSYLTQDIHLNDLLSVEENMRYAADFKLGVKRSGEKKSDIVDELLHSFGLLAARRTRAGKLSGGERKRLAIALAMTSNPRLVFLDEPTTGLDVSTTRQILAHLKKIAGMGTTIVCSIHQVCASHINFFDTVYVTAEGQCAYQGRPQDLLQFLDRNGFCCNIYHNPVDYLLELCSGAYGKDKAHRLIKASQSDGTHFQHTSEHSLTSCDDTNQITKSTWSNRFNTLLWRESVKIRRNWLLMHLRLFGTNLISLMIGLLFYDVGSDATKVIVNYHLCMCMAMHTIVCGLLYPIISFPSEMDVIKREIHNKYYSIMQYYLSVSIVDLPISIVAMASSHMLMYYLSGQPLENDRIILFLMVTIAFGTTTNALGFLIGTQFKIHHGVFVSIISQMPLFVISGVGMMPQHLPQILKNVSRALYMRAGANGFFIASLGLESRKFYCPEDAHDCLFRDSHEFLKEIEVDPSNYAPTFYVLLVWYVAVSVITFYSIKYRLSPLR